MKRFAYILIVAVMLIVPYQVKIVYSGQQKGADLIGTWSNTVRSTNSSGESCPFVPDTITFDKSQTVSMLELGIENLPYKITLTKDERASIGKRFPELKGKALLLVLPNTSMSWDNTPMVYAYSIKKNELTLILHNWSPAKFVRKTL